MKKFGIVLGHFNPSNSTSLPPVLALNEKKVLKVQLNNVSKIKFSII
jgi:hypothetical protein